MKHHYELKFPVEHWVKPDIDMSWYPETFGLTPWGDKRNWALQYPPTDKILTREAIAFLDKINILPSVDGPNTINLFRGDRKATMHIHQDPGPKWSINYIWGSENSEMAWYREGPNVKKRLWTSVTSRQAMSFEPEGMIEVDRVLMRGLQLVRIDVPHNVFNHNNSVRWAACVKDRTKDWTFEHAAEYLQEWII